MGRITRKTEKITEKQADVRSLERQTIETFETFIIPSEPPYVKMYIDAVLFLKDLPRGHNTVLLSLLKLMPWANQGSAIAINKALKRMIAKEIGCSVSRIDHALTDFVKGKILIRKDLGLYSFNPHLFGCGEWKDIEELRLTVTFDAKGKTMMGEVRRKNDHPKLSVIEGGRTGTE
jgi:hypothetical protein